MILGITRDGTGDPAGAIQMYEAGIGVDPDIPLFHFNLGQLYLSHHQDAVKAEQYFLEALRVDPNHLEAHLALGNL